MEDEIKKILAKLQVPVEHLKYKGKEKTYVVWTIIDNQPLFAGEDEILYSEVLVDIDIYSESNYLSLMSSIKQMMKENEWIWDGDSPEMYEEDTKLNHRTCTFKKERWILDG